MLERVREIIQEASYKMIVLDSSRNSCNTSVFSFLSAGRNPSKQNLLVLSPDKVRAVIQAAAINGRNFIFMRDAHRESGRHDAARDGNIAGR